MSAHFPRHTPPPRSRLHCIIARFARSKRARGLRLALPTVLAIAISACGGSGPAQSPHAPSAAPSDTALPATGAPGVATDPNPTESARLFLAQARELERDGFWEAAVAERAALLAGPLARSISPEELAGAQVDHARLLIRLARYDEALSVLAATDSAALDRQTDRVLDLMIGKASTGIGDTERAIAAYTDYLESGGSASTWARLLRAESAAGAGVPADAESDYLAILADPLAPSLDREAALLQLGLLYENADRHEEAVQQYDSLLVESPWDSDRAFALDRLGAIAWDRGDPAAAEQAWLQLLQQYPRHWRAAGALEGLDNRGLAIDPITRALVEYRQFRYADARSTLEPFLDQAPSAPEQSAALYYLAAIDEDEGNDADAIDGYLAAVDTDPDGALSDNALWWAARLLESRGQVALAGALYDRIATGYPGSEFAADAAFLAGLALYLAGDPAAAEAHFVSLAPLSAGLDAQRHWLWAGKARAQLGDAEDAHAAYENTRVIDPFSYYGLRAEALLEEAHGAPTLLPTTIGSESARQASSKGAAWLDARVGPEPLVQWERVKTGSAWTGAVELWQAGLRAEAVSRFLALIEQYRSQPWLLYRMAQEFDRLDAVALRLEAAAALIGGLPAAARPEAPRYILAWAYPRGWPTLASRTAGTYGLDELLLYALIRQESRFNPEAGSSAGALGLTQVIEATGEEIALALGVAAYRREDLLRPARSIEFGAYYLARQLEQFAGGAGIALAAYNGGPGNAARWGDTDPGGDPDLFYEHITFPESRLYVRLVLENYAWYSFVYRQTDHPSLLTSADGRIAVRGAPEAGAPPQE